ncbi:MAG: dihydropteroate synthase [Dehalococcoidales bacterium]|nr:dihydropteroate synthase [Dehalococcoidales bacterium]
MVVLIAESINIMSKSLGPAMRERVPGPIQEMAKAEVAADADYLDLNIGPARKAGDELMQWVVKTVREVTDAPLSLDTTNPVAMEAGLKVYTGKGRPLMNSISPIRLAEELPMVRKYNAYMIGLLWGLDGMPRDANERGMLAVDLIYKANEAGIPNEDIWIDPIATPVSQIEQVKSCFEFMSMLGDMAPGCKSTVGLSNISNGSPAHLRPSLNRAFLAMLMKYNIYSAIVDVADTELVKIAHGQLPEIVSLVHRIMDGDRPDPSTLTKKELEYYKTVRVLLGETMYSDSWLEL